MFLSKLSILLSTYFQEFVANEGNGELPLEGTIPDMTSLTESVFWWCHPYFLWSDSNPSVITIYLNESIMFLVHNICSYYVSLQRIYQAKAESDCLAMEHRVKDILKRIGRDPNSISRAYIKTFCKNARKLRVSCFLQITYFVASVYSLWCYNFALIVGCTQEWKLIRFSESCSFHFYQNNKNATWFLTWCTDSLLASRFKEYK